MLNFLIIGTNFISDSFVDAAKKVEDVCSYAVYSRAEETAVSFAKKHGIKKYGTTLQSLLADENIDAVYVASPTVCHPEHALAALAAGKHVLSEKMIAPTYAELELMKSFAKKSGRVLLEAMRPAHDPFYDTVKEYLPRLGKLRRAHLEFCQYSSRYDRFRRGILTNAFDRRMKNSALSDIGIYPLYAAVMLFGEPISAFGSSVFLEGGFEGAGEALLTYPEMTVGISYSKIADSTTPSVIEGEDGSLHIDKISAPTSLTYIPRGGEPVTVPTPTVNNNMIYEIRAFRDMCAGLCDHTPYLDLTDKVTRLADSLIRESGIIDV